MLKAPVGYVLVGLRERCCQLVEVGACEVCGVWVKLALVYAGVDAFHQAVIELGLRQEHVVVVLNEHCPFKLVVVVDLGLEHEDADVGAKGVSA